MKNIIVIVGMLVLMILWSVCVRAQEDDGFEAFYGKKDFAGVSAGYNYLLTTPGYVGSAEFFYLTQSKKSAQAKNWQNYYGVSLEFAYAQGTDFEFDDGKGDFDAWWMHLWISDRIYQQDYKKVRPYIDFGAGVGWGQFKGEGNKEDDEDAIFEIDWRSMDMVQARVGVGAEFMLDDKWALDLGVSGVGMAGLGKGLQDQADLEFAGAQAHIGISKWTERK
jgi:opacity protein-like surface antigen